MSTTQQEHTRDPALTPVPTTLPRAGGREVLGAVGRRLRPQLPRTLGSLVVLLASAGCGLVMPLVLGIVVDAVTGNVTHHPLIGDGDPWRVLAVLLIALAVGSALNGLGTAWSSRCPSTRWPCAATCDRPRPCTAPNVPSAPSAPAWCSTPSVAGP
nr:hypothetical protein [Kocuria sp. cx-455]